MRFVKLKKFAVAAGLLPASVMARARSASQKSELTGVCTYYASMRDGYMTASGETFDSNALTAAHRNLPLGARLKVTNLANGKSVVVRVNDRGPFIRGRSLSVTRRAAEELGFVLEGHAKVKMEPVD